MSRPASQDKNDFEAGAFRFEGETRLRPGLRIFCSECHKAYALRFTTSGGGRAVPQEFAEQRFRSKGWHVGRNRRQDVCPKCLSKPVPTKPKIVAEPVPEPKQEAKMSENVVPITPPPAPAPVRTPTPSDRRKILDRIEDAQLITGDGYKLGASDETIAKGLGVPRAWVADVREQMFGFPDADVGLKAAREEIAAIQAEQKQIEGEAKAISDLHQALLKAISELSTRVTTLSRKFNI